MASRSKPSAWAKAATRMDTTRMIIFAISLTTEPLRSIYAFQKFAGLPRFDTAYQVPSYFQHRILDARQVSKNNSSRIHVHLGHDMH
jgi:hypothetical protein